MIGRLRPPFVFSPGARRILLVLLALLLSAIVLLPRQTQVVLQHIGRPLAQVVAVPMEVLATLDESFRNVWARYLQSSGVYEENRQLQQDVQHLQSQVTELREMAIASERLAALLDFQKSATMHTVAARVIGRNASNWYQALILNKGEQHGILVEMGVIIPSGVVGRIVKTTPFTSIVLLLTDPNIAITSLIQRTRDEGIVQGTAQSSIRMKYLPPLALIEKDDMVVTSGLTGHFPRGLLIGTVTRVEKDEADLFQSAEIQSFVDFSKLEEVLVITSPHQSTGGSAFFKQSQSSSLDSADSAQIP